LERLLDERVASEPLGQAIEVVVGDAERYLLNSIVTHGEYKRPGYWTCAEVLGSVFPDIETLDAILSALKRTGPGPYPKSDLLGVRRCVWTISAQEFAATFHYVAQLLDGADWKEDPDTRRALASGLCLGSVGDLPELYRALKSDDQTAILLACRVCATIEEDEDIGLSAQERHYLAEHLQEVRRRSSAGGPSQPFLEEPLLAVACISPHRTEIEEVGAIVRERLSHNEPLSSELVMAYANGMARIEGTEGRMGYAPLSPKRFASLDRPPVMSRVLGASEEDPGSEEIDYDLDVLAIDISNAQDFEEVVQICNEYQDLLETHSLTSRPEESLSLFPGTEQALDFVRHYARLATEGPAEFVAALFPELLSALACGRGASNRKRGEVIGEIALNAIASLAQLAAHDSRLRDLATSRLSPSDWDFLGRLHLINESAFERSYPELGLAGLALRAALEDDSSWHTDFTQWWLGMEPTIRQFTEGKGVSFVSTIAERRRPGAGWELVRTVPLRPEFSRELSDLALGLLAYPADSTSRICVDMTSDVGSELGRALFLAQMMTRFVTDEQRTHLIRATKALLDEPDVLSLDAVMTLGALSRDRSDAELLLGREPAYGGPDGVYRVTCAKAAASIVRAAERAARR
jgi:hypothetical protein